MTGTPAGVEIWLVDAARAGPALAALEAATARLADDERARAAAHAHNGEDWRVFRIALRVLLERFLGPGLRRAPFRSGPWGKPALPWPAGVEFSLSHSGRHALIAISRSAVGVDLEHDRRVRFPTDRQQAMLAAAGVLASPPSTNDPASCPFGILQAWVRLEAWGKARGSGVGALLHDLGIRGPAWTAHGNATDFGPLAVDLLRREGFELHDLVLPPGLYGALVTRELATPQLIRAFPTDRAGVEALAAQRHCSAAPSPTG